MVKFEGASGHDVICAGVQQNSVNRQMEINEDRYQFYEVSSNPTGETVSDRAWEMHISDDRVTDYKNFRWLILIAIVIDRGERETDAVEEGLESPVQMTSSLSVEGIGPTLGHGNDGCGSWRGGQFSEKDPDEGDEHLRCLPWDISGLVGGVRRFLRQEFGRAGCSGAEREHVAGSSVSSDNFSRGVKKLDNEMGSSSYSSRPGKNNRRETGLPFLTTVAQEEEGVSDVRWTVLAELEAKGCWLPASSRHVSREHSSICRCKRSSMSRSMDRSSVFSSATSVDGAISGTVRE